MKRLGILLSASGLAKLTAFQFLTALAIVALATFSLVNFATGLTPIGLLAAAFLLVSAFEFLKSRAIARRTEISAVWPEAIDSMISGLSAGLSITEALIDLAETGPKSLRPHFDYFVKQLATGKSLASCLEHLKTQFAHPDTDSTATPSSAREARRRPVGVLPPRPCRMRGTRRRGPADIPTRFPALDGTNFDPYGPVARRTLAANAAKVAMTTRVALR